MNTKVDAAVLVFKEKFGTEELIVKSPSRANIIGEHIDYCRAKVLPFATEPAMYFLVKKTKDKVSQLFAFDKSEYCELKDSDSITAYPWANYFLKILKELKRRYSFAQSIQLLFTSSIPIGGGLSSSSALCCGFLYSINELYGLNISKAEMIEISSAAEYGLGLQGGIMDQYTLLFGQKEKALSVDCAKRTNKYIDLNKDKWHFVLIGSSVKHRLIGSEYNTRRKQAQRALEQIRSKTKTQIDFIELNEDHLSLVEEGKQRDRLKHIVSEIKRVDRAEECLIKDDQQELGKLLWQSHASLKSNYEVSCEELDYLVDELKNHEEVLGARIMGGGFGGHAICLLRSSYISDLFEGIKENYFKTYNLEMTSFEVSAVDGINCL